MFNRGSSAWRRALLTEFECEDSKEGLRELFGTEREDALIKLAYANFIREYSYFRRFDLLNFTNITLMQDELVKVQQEVESKRSPFSQENHGVKFRNLLETYSMPHSRVLNTDANINQTKHSSPITKFVISLNHLSFMLWIYSNPP
jgi:hypothetical protein